LCIRYLSKTKEEENKIESSLKIFEEERRYLLVENREKVFYGFFLKNMKNGIDTRKLLFIDFKKSKQEDLNLDDILK